MLKRAERWIRALRLITAVVLIALILRYVDWPELINTMLRLRLPEAAAAVAAFAAVSLVEAQRLRQVLTPRQIPYAVALKIHVIGSAPANVTPAQIGGDAYRIFRLGGGDFDLLTISARIALLRVLGVLLVVPVAAVALTASAPLLALLRSGLSRWLTAEPAWWLLALLLAAATAGLWLSARLARRYAGLLSGIGPTTVARLLLASLLMLALRSATIALLCRSLGLGTSLTDALLVTCLAILATALPISIAGIGVREGAIVGLLTAIGAGYEESVGVALLSRLLMVALGLLGVGWWLLERRPPGGPRQGLADRENDSG